MQLLKDESVETSELSVMFFGRWGRRSHDVAFTPSGEDKKLFIIDCIYKICDKIRDI